TRACYACDSCGWQIYPTKGTIFQKSTTSLQLWFYAMYLMASTRCGISAKQLERELGVTYKTAWRMFNKIRNDLMHDQDDEPLSGDVEIDETSVRGKLRDGRGMTRSEKALWREAQPSVLGMVERGGKVRLRVIPSRRGPALSREARANVDPTAIIFTDDWQAYKPLRGEFLDHRIINHSAGIYVEGDVHTNTIEGFFGNMKTGMRGAYKKISRKWLQSYLDEFAWRHNNRYGKPMFERLLARAASK
ncbi:MAG: IS1595 family transposase, partial [Actinomycetota bacterium]